MNKTLRILSILALIAFTLNASAKKFVLKEGTNEVNGMTVDATFTVTKAGKVLIEAQQVYEVTCNEQTYENSWVPGNTLAYVYNVTGVKVDDVISIKTSFLQNSSGSKIRITQYAEEEIIPVNLVSVSPEQGSLFNWSNTGIVSLTFNKVVNFSDVELLTTDKQHSYPISEYSHSGNNVGINISNAISKAYEEKTLSPEEVFYLRIRNICDANDENSKYVGTDGDATLELKYKAPYPQYNFVDAMIGGEHLSYTNSNTYKMKSFYDPSIDTDGIITISFDNEVKSLENVVLTMGNIDLLAAGKFHRSQLEYSIKGKDVIIDLRGTLRSLHALFPNIVEGSDGEATEMLDFDTKHVTISLNNVVDIYGNPFLSVLPGSIGSFAFTMGYEEVDDNVVIDGNNIVEDDAVNNGQEISLWVSEKVQFDAINVAYYVPASTEDGATVGEDGFLGYEVKNITVNNFTITDDPNKGIIVTFTMPVLTNAVEAQPVIVSLVNAKSENGIPHDLSIKFAYGKRADNPDDPDNPGNPSNPTLPEAKYALHTYTSNDGGILMGMSKNGKWGIIRLGNSDAGGDAIPEIYDVDNETRTPIVIGNEAFDIQDISNDGNIVVGSFHGLPASYNLTTKKLTQFALRKNWQYGSLSSVTPDGRYAVGCYNVYTGNVQSDTDVPNEYYFAPLYVDIQTGDTLHLKNMPRYNQAHNNENATALREISADGRYIIGAMDWFYMSPVSGCLFVYDTQTETYDMMGFTEGATPQTDWTPYVENLHHIESAMFSPDGKLVAGNAYMARPRDYESEFFNEYIVPYIHNIAEGTTTFFDDAESSNISVGAVDNEGTILGNPESGGPLRNFRVFYKNKYWISFADICKQRFGFNFSEKTDYEYVGTAMGISDDATRIVVFSDPTSESYIFDGKETIETSCSAVDMFANYATTPENNAVFSTLENVEINFGRAIQVLGKGNTHVHLYKADGTLIANALSTTDGLKLKASSTTTVTVTFRPITLEDGQKYYITIDAGAIAVANDADVRNHALRIDYTGRKAANLQMIKVSPADGTQLRQLDNEASYINMAFDCPVKLSDEYNAYLERANDGSRITALTIAVGNNEQTRNQIMLTPASTTYLYKDIQYRAVLEAGSLTDRAGQFANEKVSVTYTGTYVREVTNESVMFADNFNNPNESLGYWLMYEGDHNQPNEDMRALGFDADNTPWNFSTRDNLETNDYFATSHSSFTTSGTADDWMLTPQLKIPACIDNDRVVLEFDAQNYKKNCADKLKIYVYEDSRVLTNPLNSYIQDIKAGVKLLDEITLTPGKTEGNTAGEWIHYQYDLTPWAEKDIYIAFVNQNENQSAIFVDNVIIQREVLYTIGFTNLDRVVKEDKINIGGHFTVELNTFKGGSVSLTLKDQDDNIVDTFKKDVLVAVGKKPSFDFAFSKPLPLTIGQENPYTIDITIGDRNDTYKGAILDLVFEPVKRVVLEEMTGYTCQFCPQGLIAIEQCERTYGDRFIPVGIHSYTGDRWGDGLFNGYTNYLGLAGAPSARINRIEGIYDPMFSTNADIYYDMPEKNLWYNVVAQELNKLTTCEVALSANYSEDNTQIDFNTRVRYALDAENQQLSLFIVLLENGIKRYQQNGLYQNEWPGLGEWGKGGIYGSGQPDYVHNDVVRACIGQTYSGTIGLFPGDFVAGDIEEAKVSTDVPKTISNKENVFAVAMLIDTQSGQIINATKARVLPYGVEDGISVPVFINNDNMYNIQGQRVADNYRGIVIKNGKKIFKK